MAIVESRGRGQVFRVGPIGRGGEFIGPFGLNRCFRKKWPIDDLKTNIERGCIALQGGNKLHVLKRYNTKCNDAYVYKVMQITGILKERNARGDPDPTRGLERI